MAFGESYHNVDNYLYPYFIMMICLGIIGPASEVLIASGKDQIVRKAGTISVIIVILVFAVPVYGVPVAIAAGASSYVIFYFICYWYSINEST